MTYMHNEKVVNVWLLKTYSLVFVLTALGASLRVFYLSRVPELVYDFLFLLLGALLCFSGGHSISDKWKTSIFALLLCCLYVAVNFSSIFPLVACLFYTFLILLSDTEKISIFNVSNKLFASFICCSIVFWSAHLLGISLPNSYVEYDGRFLYNYVFFLKSSNLLADYRFQGLFVEPGHLGMLSSFMIFASKFSLKKKETLVYLMAILLSLSLAAYLLTIIGFLLYSISNIINRRKIFFMVFATILLILATFLYSQKNQDSIIYQEIFFRLEYSDGNINGNNRYQDDFISFYDKKMKDTSTMLWGLGSDFDAERYPGNSGYKIFLIQYGLFGAFLVFMFYLSLVIHYKSRLSYALLILYFVSFIQRPYIWSVFEVGLFIISLPVINTRDNRIAVKDEHGI